MSRLSYFNIYSQVFLTFYGEDRHTALGFHPHDMYKFVLIAMAPLAVLAFITGYFMDAYKAFIYQIGESVQYEMSEHTHHLAMYLGALVVIIAVLAIFGVLYILSNATAGLGRRMGNVEEVHPKLIVDNTGGKTAPFVDATSAQAGGLLGYCKHDPLQSGGLGTPAHLRMRLHWADGRRSRLGDRGERRRLHGRGLWRPDPGQAGPPRRRGQDGGGRLRGIQRARRGKPSRMSPRVRRRAQDGPGRA